MGGPRAVRLDAPFRTPHGGGGLGDIELEVLHTPGHTEGSVCLLSRSDGLVFTGDTGPNPALWQRLAASTTARKLPPDVIFTLAEALFGYIEQISGASVAGFAGIASERLGGSGAIGGTS